MSLSTLLNFLSTNAGWRWTDDHQTASLLWNNHGRIPWNAVLLSLISIGPAGRHGRRRDTTGLRRPRGRQVSRDHDSLHDADDRRPMSSRRRGQRAAGCVVSLTWMAASWIWLSAETRRRYRQTSALVMGSTLCFVDTSSSIYRRFCNFVVEQSVSKSKQAVASPRSGPSAIWKLFVSYNDTK